MIEVELPDGSIAEFPAGTSDADIEKALAHFMDASAPHVAEQDDRSWAVDEDGEEIPDISGAVDVATGAAKNLIPSLGRVVGDTVEAIAHPVDTATNLARLGAGYGQKAWRAAGGDTDGEYIPYADAMNEHFASRYGSSDAIAETLKNDPGGMLADLSTIFTGGAGASSSLAKGAALANKTAAAQKLAKAAEVANKAANLTDPLRPIALAAKPVTAPVGVLGREAAKLVTPEAIYRRNLKPSTTLDEAKVERLINAGLQERIPITQKGLAKADTRIDQIGKQVQDSVSDPALANVRLNRIDLGLEALDDVLPRFEKQVAPTEDVNAIVQKVADFWGDVDATKPDLTLPEAQAVKQGTYRNLKERAYDKQQGAGVEAEKALARALKRGIEKHAPQVKAMNAKQGALIELAKELNRAVNRMGNWSGLGSLAGHTGLGGALGYMIGGPVGGAIGSGLGILSRQPGVQSQMAFLADDLRRAYRRSEPARRAALKARRPTTSAVYLGSILDRIAEDE